MDIFLKNRYFRRECLYHTWVHFKACTHNRLWIFDYICKCSCIKTIHFVCTSGNFGLLQKMDKKYVRLIANKMLFISANKGYLDIIKYLINMYRGIISENDFEHMSYNCALGNHVHIMDYLFSNKFIDSTHLSWCIGSAVRNGHMDMVQYLVEHGADINFTNNPQHPLNVCVQNRQTAILEYLIMKGADINVCDGIALRYCTEIGYLKLVKYLVEHGANIHVNVLSKSIQCGHIEIVKYLVSMGAVVSHSELSSCMCMGKNWNFELFQYLFENANIPTNSLANSLLYDAIYTHRVEIVRFLVEKGANIRYDIRNHHNNALVYCLTVGNIETLKYLLGEGILADKSIDTHLLMNEIPRMMDINKFTMAQYLADHLADRKK